MSPLTRALAVAASLLVTAALAPAAPASAEPAAAGSRSLVLHGSGVADADTADGVYRYDPALVPDGARLAVLSLSSRDRTRTLLAVRGLLPNRTYGAHLHVNPCGALPTAAGPHYQQVPDPVQPSVDPAYANRRNEVWLDVTTNASGHGVSGNRNPWKYRAAPRSLVLHAEATHTEPGHAGMAGARVACLTLTVGH